MEAMKPLEVDGGEGPAAREGVHSRRRFAAHAVVDDEVAAASSSS